ncbi:MAG: hypothetical protein HY791_08955 [Deltaproteobacteria bacterium]|nr:hypothetical protein [Deltaproteobacteria bacterium]
MSLPRLTRRTLVGGAAVAALGVTTGAWILTRRAAGHSALSERQLRTAAALAETALAVPPNKATELADKFDAFIATEPIARATEAKQALLLLELGPLVLERALTTFAGLDPDARERHFTEKWMTHESELRRQVSIGLLRFFQLVYFDDPDSWVEIGYPGPSLRVTP